MKIKGLFLLLVLLLSVCLVLGLASCGEDAPAPDADPGENEQPGNGNAPEGEGGEAPHSHAFGNWTVIKTATCGTKGERLRICACGEREYATDFATEDHRYGADNKCIVCGDQWIYYEELFYELNADGMSYAIVGFGGSVGESLTLPYFYNGLPVTTVAGNVFKNCTELTELNIGDYITTIGSSAFEGCSALTTIRFEKNSRLSIIGDRAFAKTAITVFEIPSEVIALGNGVFAQCLSLELSVAEGNMRYTVAKDGALIDQASKTLLRAGSTGEIPTTVTSIASYAFSGCGTDEIVIPKNVTKLSPEAFAECGATKVSFAVTEGWFVSELASGADAVSVSISADAAENLTALTVTYAECYWFFTAPNAQ